MLRLEICGTSVSCGICGVSVCQWKDGIVWYKAKTSPATVHNTTATNDEPAEELEVSHVENSAPVSLQYSQVHRVGSSRMKNSVQ